MGLVDEVREHRLHRRALGDSEERRLGRSLGLHLLLASQRLDEGRLRGLESHLSYRIALRTFSAAESRAVLGVPDAHQLPPTPGAAFLATGTDELVRFRAAYVSGAAGTDLPGPPGRRTAHLFTATPVPLPEETPERFRAIVERVRSRPTGDYVLRMFRDEKRPKADRPLAATTASVRA